MLMILASACSCWGVQEIRGEVVETSAEARGKSGYPWRRSSSSACASQQVFAHGRFDEFQQLGEQEIQTEWWRNRCRSREDTASGGVIVPLEVEMRVHLPSDE